MNIVPTLIKDKDGKLTSNPAMDYIQPYFLTLDDPNNPIVLTANQTRYGLLATARHTGPIEIAKQVYQATSTNFTVVIKHPGLNTDLMNREIHAETIFGVGQRAFVYPESLVLNAIQALEMTLRDLSGNENTIRLIFPGSKYYQYQAFPELGERFRQWASNRPLTYPYFLTTRDAVSLVNQSEQSFELPVFDDADFEIMKITCRSTGTFTWNLEDIQSGRAMSNSSLPSTLIGTGEYPTIMRPIENFLIRRSMGLTLKITDTSGATAQSPNVVWFTLSGRKISYYRS